MIKPRCVHTIQGYNHLQNARAMYTRNDGLGHLFKNHWSVATLQIHPPANRRGGAERVFGI